MYVVTALLFSVLFNLFIETVLIVFFLTQISLQCRPSNSFSFLSYFGCITYTIVLFKHKICKYGNAR